MLRRAANNAMNISKPARVLTWIGFNMLALIGLPMLTFVALDKEISAAHLANPQLSGDGDSLGIPVFGVAILTFVVLLVINAALGFFLWSHKRGSQSSDELRPPLAKP